MAEDPQTKNDKPETQENRAGRDDFGRLLYFVFEEIRAQRKAREKAS